jgi:hypothetical protein
MDEQVNKCVETIISCYNDLKICTIWSEVTKIRFKHGISVFSAALQLDIKLNKDGYRICDLVKEN